MRAHRDEVVCDLAETYHIYDMRQIPPVTLATLVLGLRDDSRTMRKIKGYENITDDMLLTVLLDELRTIRWFMSTDGEKGRNRPESMFETIYQRQEKHEQKENKGFKTAEQYEKARAQILKGIEQRAKKK